MAPKWRAGRQGYDELTLNPLYTYSRVCTPRCILYSGHSAVLSLHLTVYLECTWGNTICLGLSCPLVRKLLTWQIDQTKTRRFSSYHDLPIPKKNHQDAAAIALRQYKINLFYTNNKNNNKRITQSCITVELIFSFLSNSTSNTLLDLTLGLLVCLSALLVTVLLYIGLFVCFWDKVGRCLP